MRRILLQCVMLLVLGCCHSVMGQQKYVIVSPSEFRSQLQPFVQWKRSIGFLVAEYYVDTSSPDVIKSQLQFLYDNATPLNPAPTYVLLVGDVDRIGTFTGISRPQSDFALSPTDLYYVDFAGDYHPEAMVGRWSVADTLQLAQIVAKTLDYEHFRFYSADYLNRVLLVAGREYNTTEVPVPTITNGQVDYVSRAMREANPNMDTACFYNPDSEMQLDTILSLLAAGRGVVSYTGHCETWGWMNPDFSNAVVDTIPDLFPSCFINNCCSSSNFSEDCFGEHLLRKPHGGAVGVIGASNKTMWNEDYYWSVGAKYPFSLSPVYDESLLGMFDRWLHRRNESLDQQVATLGQMLHAGNASVQRFGSIFERYYWECYNVLGDPSLMPYWRVPETVALLRPDSVALGATQLSVAGQAGMRVSVSQDTVLLATAVIPSEGFLDLRLRYPVTASSICLTAVGQNQVPIIDTLPTYRPQSAPLVVTCYELNLADSARLRFQVQNIGLHTVSDHVAHFENENVVLPVLSPGSSTSVELTAAYQPDTMPYFQSLLTLSADSTPYSRLRVVADWNQPFPELQEVTVTDVDGNPVKYLRVGAEYAVSVRMGAHADSVRIAIAEYPNEQIFTTLNEVYADEAQMPFVVSVDARRLCLTVDSYWGEWHRSYRYWMPVGSAIECFEQDSFGLFPWDTASLHPWHITADRCYQGLHSVRSGAVVDGQQTQLSIRLNVLNDDTVGFVSSISSEEVNDRLYFYIDDELQNYWSGSRNWRRSQFAIAKGFHELKWVYSKNMFVSRGNDCAWIDDVRFPLSLWDTLGAAFDTILVAVPSDATTDETVTIYPNPAGSQCHIAVPEGFEGEMYIYDTWGRKLRVFEQVPQLIDLQGLSAGVYTVVIQNNNNRIVKKLMIAR